MLHAEGLNLILTTFVPEDAPILCDADHDRGAIWVGSGNGVYWFSSTDVRASRFTIHGRCPECLGANVNVPNWQDVNPSLSFDNRTMLMASRRPGGIGAGTFDIYMTTRKLIGGEDN